MAASSPKIDSILKDLLDIKFNYLHVIREFTAWTSFRETRLNLSSKFDNYVTAFLLRDVVAIQKLKSKLGGATDKLQQVVSSSKKLRYDSAQPEWQVVEELAQQLLLPLCQSVTLEPSNHDVEKLQDRMVVSPIGMGSKQTWHGTSDCRANVHTADCGAFPSQLNVILLEEDDDGEDDGGEEDGDNILVQDGDKFCADSYGINAEGKRNIRNSKKNTRSQVVAMTVVASWINRNNNISNSELTPVLLMCKRRIRVCLYNCKADILGYSEEVPYPLGVYLLWVILHYRYMCMGTR